MIILTREAVTAVHGAIDRAGKPGFGLRLSAESNGCAGPRYAMSLEDEPQADDVVVEIRDLRVFVDPDSMTLWLEPQSTFHPPLKGQASPSTTPTLEVRNSRIPAQNTAALAANRADKSDAPRPHGAAREPEAGELSWAARAARREESLRRKVIVLPRNRLEVEQKPD